MEWKTSKKKMRCQIKNEIPRTKERHNKTNHWIITEIQKQGKPKEPSKIWD